MRFRGGRYATMVFMVMRASSAVDSYSYNYEDIVPQYCHTAKDWGPLPERPDGASELIQVQAFIRHGARTPSDSDYCWAGRQEGTWTCSLNYLYSSVSNEAPLSTQFRVQYMPDRNAIPGNCMTGQLVDDGWEMEANNGRRLRSAYVERDGFLPNSLPLGDDSLFFRSTDVPRTKQSGMALISGLYPSDATTIQNYPTLNTMDYSQENMHVNSMACPAAVRAADAYFEGLPNKEEIFAQCRAFHPAKKFIGVQDCFWYLTHVIDCLMSRMCPTVPYSHGNATVPESLLVNGEEKFKILWKLVDEIQWYYFKAMAKAGAVGSFAADFFGAAMQAVTTYNGTSSTQSHKFLLWSGHDTGPMEPLYAALDLKPGPPYWPTFASMLVLEVWWTQTGVQARWISNGIVVAGPMSLQEFQDKVSAVVNSRKACHSDADMELDTRATAVPPHSQPADAFFA